jgi:hypothetical protein
MDDSERLTSIADQLQRGERVHPVTVRKLLSWFHAQRRGSWVVYTIKQALEAAKLRTDPDFESEYIDAPISFELVPAPAKAAAPANVIGLSAAAVAVTTGTASLTILPAYADPTYRISKLAAANKMPISVSPDTTLSEAATLMLMNNFSQLPVMTSERDVKGVISWTSIGSRLSFGQKAERVRELMGEQQEIGSDASIFQAKPIIKQHQYVLVRGADKRICGIVTASDLTDQFQQSTEPFLVLSEVENHIRTLIDGKFTGEELCQTRDPSDSERKVARAADLNFGEYIRLLENPDRWNKLRLAVDRTAFCRQLDRVRAIRNDVMHFDPDPLPEEDLQALREFARFFQELRNIGAF